jgi:hypothetical protein
VDPLCTLFHPREQRAHDGILIAEVRKMIQGFLGLIGVAVQ